MSVHGRSQPQQGDDNTKLAPMKLRRRHRFQGAGRSGLREFRRRRWQHLRDDWRTWLPIPFVILAFGTWSLLADGLIARIAAAVFGGAVAMLLVGWVIGGHVSSLPWLWGVQGERYTAKEIEKLGAEWHCEHDMELPYGNWDHVLVGPPGIFLLDSKALHNASVAAGDALSSGRMRYSGNKFRAAALKVHDELKPVLERPQWVQAVVVVWGEFPQGLHEEENVVYLRGDELVPWLTDLSPKLNGPARAAVQAALGEIRPAIAAKRT